MGNWKIKIEYDPKSGFLLSETESDTIHNAIDRIVGEIRHENIL